MLKKNVLTSFSKTHFLGRKKKYFSLARNIESKYFREIQLHQKKIPVYKINVRNEKNPITQLNYSNGFYYLITVVQ